MMDVGLGFASLGLVLVGLWPAVYQRISRAEKETTTKRYVTCKRKVASAPRRQIHFTPPPYDADYFEALRIMEDDDDAY